ncbi:glycosyltransferase [Agarivorans albus]
MPERKKLVSIYIPTHNRCELLARALDSALRQTYSPIEIVVCDDGSTDATSKLMKRYTEAHNNIVYIRLSKVGGACKARNVAISQASGYYITGLDDDDYFDKRRVESLVDSYDEKTNSCVCSPIVAFGEEGVIKTVYSRPKSIKLSELLYFNHIGNQVLTTRSRLIELQAFDENLQSCQDYDMWVRLLDLYGECKRIGEPTYFMYVGSNHERITNSNKKSTGHRQFLEKHQIKMSASQKKSFMFFTLLATDRKLSLAKVIKLLSFPVAHIQLYSLIRRLINNG